MRLEHVSLMRDFEFTHAICLLSSQGEVLPDFIDCGGTSDFPGADPPYYCQTVVLVPITNGLLDISVPPRCAEIFKIEWEKA
jgi:hypothetical protein